MHYIIAIAAMLLLTALDQFTKYLAVLHLKPVGSIPILENIFYLSYVENQGAAFGLLQGYRWFFVVLTVVLLYLGGYYYQKLPKGTVYRWVRLAIILIGAGAVGNCIDRARNGYVVDFLYFSPINFPVFNVADICVVCGTILLAMLMLFFIREDSGKKA